jgi:purine-binding chemotaxis protein CheW
MAQDTITDKQQLVIFNLAGEPYALPISQVHEIIRYTPPRAIASADPWVQGVINLRGVIVPVYNIAARLGLHAEIGEHSKIVIVESQEQTAGLIVDAVDEVQTISSDQLEQTTCADQLLIESIAKIDDRLVVLLNPASILCDVARAV